MSKALITTILMSLLHLSLSSQERVYYPDSAFRDDFPIPELAVKWVSSQLGGHFPSAMLAVEHRVSDKLNLEHGLGINYPLDVLDDDDIYYANKGGFKSFSKVKYYTGSGPIGTHFGFEVFFNQLTFDRTRTWELPCGTDCSFFERRTYEIQNNEIGFRFNMGASTLITRRIYLETELAIGFRNNNLTSNNRPTDYIEMFGRIHPEEQSVSDYAFNLGVKLAYRIK